MAAVCGCCIQFSRSSTGMVFRSPEWTVIERVVTLGFAASNNGTVYKALLSGLITAKEIRIWRLVVYCDSQLAINKLSGEYIAHDDWMVAYVREAHNLIQAIGDVKIKQIGWEENALGDSLASLVTAVKFELRREVLIDFQPSSSIRDQSVMCAEQEVEELNWMAAIVE